MIVNRKLYSSVFLLLLTSCKNEELDVNLEPDISIQIEYAQSYFADLQDEMFVAYIYSGPGNDTVKFTLTQTERRYIKKLYYNLHLDEIEQDSVFVEDNCHTMPKLYTKMYIKRGTSQQVLVADTDCEKRHWMQMENRKQQSLENRIHRFLNEVFDIILAKSEIQSAKPSDYLYM